MTLTDREQAAMDALLPPDQQTGDLLVDLPAAFAESRRRREANSENGGRVIAALHSELASWDVTAEVLGEAVTTLRRWSEPYRGDKA